MVLKLIRWLNRTNAELGPLGPPLWLRHFVSWRLLMWLNDRLPLCWASLVQWKTGNKHNWFPESSCWSGPQGEEYDYCGKFDCVGKVHAAIDASEAPRWMIQFK
jgi:hypothetical protein